MLLVTYRCNLHCSYCYEPKTLTLRMSEEQAKRILSKEIPAFADSCDELEIHFMGGEPLLEFPMLKNLAEWLWSEPFPMPNYKLFAPTNGTLLTEEMKAWFRSHHERFYLGLSFDGDMHMQDVNRSASFGMVNLDFFASTWPDQSVKMTISPETVGHLADGVIFLHDRGFKYISADLALGTSVEWGREALLSYKSELNRLSEFYLNNPDLIPCTLLRMDILNAGRHSDKPVKSCSCGEDMVCIDLTGQHYACHLFSPISIPVEKAQKSKSIEFSNHDLFASDRCRHCFLESVCERCYGMNYICSDDVATPSPFHCSATKIRFAANCRFRVQKAALSGDAETVSAIARMLDRITK